MNMYVSATLFALLIFIYWVISLIFTVLFRLIGLPEEKAQFQVISLLTGCGFTTRESEMILSNRSRRRLARITMLFGYVFNLTIVSALINMFVSVEFTQLGGRLLSMLIPLIAIIGIVVASRTRVVRSWLDKTIGRLARRTTGNESFNSIVQLDQIGKQTIVQVTLRQVPELLQNKPLAETGLKSTHDILVMLYERGSDPPEAPNAKTIFVAGDRLVLLGDFTRICYVFRAKEFFSGADDET